MKANLDTGLNALKQFYEIVNTKEKFLVLILLWVLGVTSFGVVKVFTPETIERLFCLALHENCGAPHGSNPASHGLQAPIVPRG
jgi:hypothetical protein